MKNRLLLVICIFSILGCQQESPEYISGIWNGDKPLGKVISLNGRWSIEEGSMEVAHVNFGHSIPVPGIIKNAEPEFEDAGISSDKREAYWYKTTFSIPEEINYEIARLIIKKSRYGTVVFVNGKEVGSNMLNFTVGDFDITPYLNKGEENELIVRLGAHIENAPDTVCTAGEVEKMKYFAGIYDDVEIVLSKAPYISNVQVAPDLKGEKATVVVEMINPFDSEENVDLASSVFDFQTKEKVSGKNGINLVLAPKETKSIQFSIEIPNAKLWTPESPDLYVLELKRGDETSYTRFGMRSFRVDSNYTNKALLNEEQYFLRGTNISLFRFFEDTLCNRQPWDRQWVKSLHTKLKDMNWNSYRISISALPNFWYDIADELGFVIFDEYPMWYALQNEMASDEAKQQNINHPVRKYGVYPPKLTVERLVNEYTHWMREHWNHASVCAWDAQNETWTPNTGKAVNKVRHLDLSKRPWDNGWAPPAGKGDYREAHNYLARYNVGSEQSRPGEDLPAPFNLSDMTHKEKFGYTFYLPYQAYYENGQYDLFWDFPTVLNEYGYLWLNRDGTPTSLTKPYYDAVLDEDATADERFYHYATHLAAITEFWRANRTLFGVLHVFALSFSSDYAATGDMFLDVDDFTLYPYFEEYVADAFAPVGICIDFWETKMKKHDAGWSPLKGIEIPIVVTNDVNEDKTGTFVLELKNNKTGQIFHQKDYVIEVCALQQSRRFVKIEVPKVAGSYTLSAELTVNGKEPATSYREIEFTEK